MTGVTPEPSRLSLAGRPLGRVTTVTAAHFQRVQRSFSGWLARSSLVLLFTVGCGGSTEESAGTVESVASSGSEIVVIGGGLMGSSTAWQLARAGHDVVLIEQQSRDYEFGSSQGSARIARVNNRGDDIWSYLHSRTVSEAEALVHQLQRAGLDASMKNLYRTSPVTYVHRTSIQDALVDSLERQGVTYELATSPEEGRDLFGAALPPDVLMMREYNEYSGTVDPSAMIEALHDALEDLGGVLRFESKVTRFVRRDDGPGFAVEVERVDGATETLLADQVVAAAGPWVGPLLSEINPNISRLIEPQRVFLAFFKPTRESWNALDDVERARLLESYPVINSSAGTRSGSYFSMIEELEDDLPIIKIGGHFQRSGIGDLESVWSKDLSTDEVNWALENTLGYMSLIDVPLDADDFELTDGYSCVYSLTSNEVPYVSEVPDTEGRPIEGLVVLGGLSGVGAKGSLTYGLLASELLLGTTDPDLKMQALRDQMGFERLLADLESLPDS